MSQRRFLISLFLVWHLVAIVAAVIPATGRVQAPKPVQPDAGNWLAVRLAPMLDAVAGFSFTGLATLRRLVAPVRATTSPYLNTLGFDEYWTMFSNPPKFDQYVRVRYFIQGNGGVRTATELVFPAVPEYTVRGFQSFRGSYRDRAINTMLERYHGSEPSLLPGSASVRDESPYLPLVNHFAYRYARLHLLGAERINRIEVWHGVAPNPPPGSNDKPPASRLDVLRDYSVGLADALGPSAPAAQGEMEREADISWAAEYTQTK